MVHGSPSFIDVVALPSVRERFSRGEALVALSEDLETVLWANGPGAALLGFPDIEAAMGAPLPLGNVARRQIMAASGFPQIGGMRPAAVRVIGGRTSRTLVLQAGTLELPSGDRAILLVQPLPDADARDASGRAIAGIAQPGQFATLLNREGGTLAASPGFAELGLPAERLAALAAEADGDRARPLKRMIEAQGRAFPAGFARLTDDLCLLIVVDEGEPAAPAAGSEEPEVADTSDELEAPTPAEEPAAKAVKAPPPVLSDAERRVRDWREAPALRFTWQMDADARFRSISPEFIEALRLDREAILGRSFSEAADRFGLDAGGDIAALLKDRHTWSGRSVTWPTGDGQIGVPVDLAALPTFNRGRVFGGYRGFGVARLAEAVILEKPLAPEPHTPEPSETSPAELESPQGAIQPVSKPAAAVDAPPPHSGAWADAEAAAPSAAEVAKGLSPHERTAFREIGERLRADDGGHAPGREPETTASLARSGARFAPEKPAGLPLADDAGQPEEPADTPAPDLADAEPNAAVAAGVEEPKNNEPEQGREAIESAEPASPEAEELPPTRSDASAEEAAEPALANALDPVWIEPGADAPAESAAAVPAAQEERAPAPAIPSGEPPRSPKPWAGDGGFFLPRRSPLALGSPADRRPAPADTALLDRLPIPVLIHSGDALHYANDEFFGLTGYADLEALRAAGGLDALFSEPRGPEGSDAAENRRVRLRGAEGGEIPVEAYLRAVPWQDGKALMLAFRPIDPDPGETALRVQLERRLDEMRTIIDTATDGVALIAADGAIRSISRPAEALFGIDAAQAQGKPFGMLFALESQRVVADYLNGLSGNGVKSVLNDGREVIGREKDGGYIPLFMTIGKLPDSSGFCAVLRDITPWKRAEEELTQSRAKAERASSHKTEFLARVSHEIRTPLNAIIGFSELMLDEKFGPIASERYRDYLRDINRSGNHVLDLVNDLLDISKIEAGEQEMAYEAVALNDSLTETIATMQPQANRERVIIRSSLAPKLPDVVADLRSIRQIGLNILSNAVRYTPAGGQVIVSTALEPSGDVALRVRDTGIGMSAGEIEQALKPFKQINALKRTRGDGTGLGLPLTKAMVEANRARFAITSTPGEGTLVEVIFPATRVLAG
ncbi:MAG TPA: histidine kinase dimerization/phospho-acceptor domain-containing protein [Mesorhizobium sp.]|jgi:PAS domain S-box-containing protein|nr:histidine kinase dimerization/phospho-acceptor domain-containing protein [Mesorhizobium sp.]